MLEYLKLVSSAVLGSGAAFAIIKLVFEKRKEERDRSEAVTYLALQLAFLFEGFTMICANGASDHRTAVESEGHAGVFLSNIPIPPAIPDSDTYRSMDSVLLNRIFAFPQRCQMAQLAADFWVSTVGDGDSYNVAVEENTIRMGLEALEISRALRSAYSIGERTLSFDKWNIDDFMRGETEKIQERIKKRDAAEHEAE